MLFFLQKNLSEYLLISENNYTFAPAIEKQWRDSSAG